MEKKGGILEVNLNEIELSPDYLIDPDMEPGSYLCLKVSDTGYGMDRAVKERIFEPYFTTKKEGKGTGLGLAVVHGIVKGIEGSIRVSSRQGKGTVCYVYLPVIKEISVVLETEKSKTLPTGNEHILLVDDGEMILSVEKQMLEKLGYHLITRTSGMDALKTFSAQPDKFDLVITDMTMPNMTGDKLAIKLLEIRPCIPVIICTGFSSIMSREQADALGVKGFLMKPIVMKDIAGSVREALDKTGQEAVRE